MRPYFPGGTLNALASSLEGSTLQATSVQCLGRGLQGYLILFAPHAFVPQRQDCPSYLPSLLVFRTISTDFTPTPCVPIAPSIFEFGSFRFIPRVEPEVFKARLSIPPTNTLRPINPDNACGFCITAAAGTELAPAYSWSTVIRQLADSSPRKVVYDPKNFILHAMSLDQGFPHCPIFSAAATRRCLGRVAVPVLGNRLSPPLTVIALVSRYLTN